MIHIENIFKNFGQKAVLQDVSFDVTKGSTVAIIGPSGCGKSTLLRLIIGLLKPDRGNVMVDGKNVVAATREELVTIRRKVGMVFQSSALFSSLTVFENVAFGLREQRDFQDSKIRHIVEEKLEMVGLKEAGKLMPEELSGGMQKRVSLARALATNPDVVLYDEPTTGLDPIMSTAIEDLIRKLDQQLRMTAIVVTHQLSTVYRVADRILMLHQGRIREAGTPNEAQRSKDPVIQEFVTGGRKE